MGTVAKYFGGAAQFEYLMRLDFRDVWFLYKLYEFQAVFDEVIDELSHDVKPKKKKLPAYKRIIEMVEIKIKERIGKAK